MKQFKDSVRTLLATLLLFVFLPAATADNNVTVEKIKKSYKELLKPRTDNTDPFLTSLRQIKPETEINDQVIEDVIFLYPFNKEEIKKHLNNITPVGLWPDINYKDQTQSGWAPYNHLRKLLELTRVLYTPLKDEFGEKRSKRPIFRLDLNT